MFNHCQLAQHGIRAALWLLWQRRYAALAAVALALSVAAPLWVRRVGRSETR